MSRRRRNPGLGVTTAALAATLLVGAGVIIVHRRRKLPSLPKQWWVAALEPVMPKSSDYGGWLIEDVGFYDETVGAPYRLAWRILRLTQPQTSCTPPCEYLVVAVGDGAGRHVRDLGSHERRTKRSRSSSRSTKSLVGETLMAKKRRPNAIDRRVITAGILAPYLVFAALLGTTWLIAWKLDKSRSSEQS